MHQEEQSLNITLSGCTGHEKEKAIIYITSFGQWYWMRNVSVTKDHKLGLLLIEDGRRRHQVFPSEIALQDEEQ